MCNILGIPTSFDLHSETIGIHSTQKEFTQKVLLISSQQCCTFVTN